MARATIVPASTGKTGIREYGVHVTWIPFGRVLKGTHLVIVKKVHHHKKKWIAVFFPKCARPNMNGGGCHHLNIA